MPVIRYLTKVHFGEGVFEEALGIELDAHGLRRPFVILGRAPGSADLRRRVAKALSGRHPLIHPAEAREPDPDACQLAIGRYLAEGCDGLVAIGCDAILDLAKVVALGASHGPELAVYAVCEGGSSRIRGPLPPLFVVPVLAGTGGEVEGVASVRLPDGDRLVFASPALVPALAILDPTLARGLPADVVLRRAVRTLLRCFESYLASPYNPPADGLALDGLRRCWRRLADVGRRDDGEVRRELTAAALEGGLAAQKGGGIGQALVAALAGLAPPGTDAGAIAAALLPAVLEFNRPAVADRFVELAHQLDLPSGDAVPAGVAHRLSTLGLPDRLGRLGFDAACLALAAERAEADRAHRTNPRRACAGELRALLLRAL